MFAEQAGRRRGGVELRRAPIRDDIVGKPVGRLVAGHACSLFLLGGEWRDFREGAVIVVKGAGGEGDKP